MNRTASLNSSTPMNCVAGNSPRAFGSHGPPPGQPACGSGKTAPSESYEESSVATGVALAGAATHRHTTAATAAQIDLLTSQTPAESTLRCRGCYHEQGLGAPVAHRG